MINARKRKAGMLMHISSLPGEYGIGDMGAGARAFADFLADAGFTAWQVLPLGPTAHVFGHSPYSSHSAFAGNILFIDPEWLAEKGLLAAEVLRSERRRATSRCDFECAEVARRKICEAAYDNFRRDDAYRTTFRELSDEFWDFCMREGYWLEDYALFSVLKEEIGEEAWSDWPQAYAMRDWSVLDPYKLRPEIARKIDIRRFEQFVFSKQLGELRTYCNDRNIELIGDMPIYVGYDSADVWGHQDLFELDADGHATVVAGVPPDYFSETGQRWGNPIYRWQRMREDGYYWWLGRFHHALQGLDRVRIDHFRGFLGYWEIPADEPTAVKGCWKAGPGIEFFHALRYCFGTEGTGEMPFIAEDLGIITEDVASAMETFGFPGMKVLQFAFGEEMPQNPYIPHHHRRSAVAYAGTHDNNTTVGWWREDACEIEKENLARYAGKDALTADSACKLLMRLAFSSTADLAVITPQDVLGLGSEARMNKPSTTLGNWTWRLGELDPLKEKAAELRELAELFDRCDRLAGEAMVLQGEEECGCSLKG